MSAVEITVGVILILIAAVLAYMILKQEGKGGIGALTGEAGGESFGRNAGKTLSATLKVWTKYGIIALFVLIVAVNVLAVYL